MTNDQTEKHALYDMLCCPACKGNLDGPGNEPELHCPSCDFTFPVIDGIPILFPCDVKNSMDELFGRYWDSEPKADLYDTNVEGTNLFGVYNHESEIYGLAHHYETRNLDVVLDAGCGNGRFMETFPDDSLKVGIDASLNLLKATKRRLRGDFLVCGELEHLPFKSGRFGTVITCRVLQHLREQESAVAEMARVTRDGGNVILELYNTWNPKTLYKAIRMMPRLRKILNAPFRLLFKSMSPFDKWGLDYDRYNNWFQVKRWGKRAGLTVVTGRGVGFGYHKYLLAPLYLDAVLNRVAPSVLERYYAACFAVERGFAGLIPLRYTLEKFATAYRKGEDQVPLSSRVRNKLRHVYKSSASYNAAAIAETRRESDGSEVTIAENRVHLVEAVNWLKRAQDVGSDRGVSRGYSVGWTSHLNTRGWQPSYPETTGYIIPTVFDCSDYLEDSDLRARALAMADWEIEVQMANGAVMGGVVNRSPTPAVFNTGQVMLGWLRTYDETDDPKYLEASERAARFLVRMQSDDGGWRRGNSDFADPNATTYNARVGWALILHGKKTAEGQYSKAGRRSIAYAISQQAENGWFAKNCLSDPSAPLTHTICYVVEGLLGAFEELGTEEYLTRARLTVDRLISHLRPDGSLPGRFDANWKGAVDWTCMTGCAQLATILLRFCRIQDDATYRDAGTTLLRFVKSTQNCIARDGGLRGGIKGSHPFDGGYGRYEVLNWPTKFFVDGLILDEGLARQS